MCVSACLLCSQDLAEHLVMHGHHLAAADHKELSSLFNLGLESHRFTMDHQVALAMANLNIPQNWNVLGSHSGNGECGNVFLHDAFLPILPIWKVGFISKYVRGKTCFYHKTHMRFITTCHHLICHWVNSYMNSLMASFLFSTLAEQKTRK